MRLVFVHATPFPRYSGGIDNWLYHMIMELERRGIEVVVFSPRSDNPPFYDIEQFRNLTLVATPCIEGHERVYGLVKKYLPALRAAVVAGNFLLWMCGSWRVLRKHIAADDRLIALQPIPSMLPLVLHRWCGGHNGIIGYVRGRVGEDLRCGGRPSIARVYVGIERYLLKHAERIICNGADTAAYVKRDCGLKCTVVPNGVDCHHFSSETGDAAGDGGNAWLNRLRQFKRDGCRIVLSVATLRDVKGIKFLIKAAAHLHREWRGDNALKIVFVGKGDPAEFRAYGESLGVDGHLVFTGEQKDIASFLWLADIGVAISGGGGISHALLEMMAAGVPIVAWNSLTYSQVLAHGVSGYLVTEMNSMALAEGIRALADEPELARRLGEEAQRTALKYDWTITTEAFLRAVEG